MNRAALRANPTNVVSPHRISRSEDNRRDLLLSVTSTGEPVREIQSRINVQCGIAIDESARGVSATTSLPATALVY